MPRSARQEKPVVRSPWHGAAKIAIWCVVSTTLLVSTIVCVELWQERERQAPRLRDWAMSFRKVFF
jgi:hypothetical protein